MWENIIITIISVTVPLLASYALKLLSRYIDVKTEDARIKAAFERVSDIVNTVVAETSQTFVDSLKKEDKWSKEAAIEAFELSKDKALALIDVKTQDVVKDYVGDFNMWLNSKIEQTVKDGK